MTGTVVAKYLIADTFKITDRGIVFAGYITEGLVSIGDTIEFSAVGMLRQRRITGIEGISYSQPGKVNTGLLIKCESLEEVEELKKWKPGSTVATIFVP